MRKYLKQLIREVIEDYREELKAHARNEAERVFERLHEMEATHYRNISFETQKIAVRESAEFAGRYLYKTPSFNHPHETLKHALKLAPSGGLALEFGVYEGITLGIIAETRRGRQVYGFDSFQGLPEEWRAGFPAGAFAVKEMPRVPGAELISGWFDETLPKFLEKHEGPVDFLHVDCDLYSSARTVLELVGPRLKPGSIVMFDEFFNYPGWQQHEYKAWLEYLARTGTVVTYEGFTFNNEQVVARIVSA